jgi:D-glycero-D-manno-heptose 1,7-bisphosphate phosphatase
VSRRAIFLDRDGTLNELVPDPVTGSPESPLHPDDVTLIPGAAAAVQRLAGAGWLLVGVSNQPAAAKGTATLRDIEAVQQRVLQLLSQAGAYFEDFLVCLHHPDGRSGDFGGECDCRKPKPGMLIAAARSHEIDLARSWMIGDTDTDVLAGHAAGCSTVLLEHQSSAHKRSGSVAADVKQADLASATDWLLGTQMVR